VLLAGVAALVLAAGAATAGILVARSDARSQAGPAQSPTRSAGPASSAPDDPAGREACRLVVLASDNDQLLVQATVAAIVAQAQSSHSFRVAFHAQMLSNKQELALADSKDHATYVSDLRSEAYEMQADCIKEGLSD
jgi:hypothetical protein